MRFFVRVNCVIESLNLIKKPQQGGLIQPERMPWPPSSARKAHPLHCFRVGWVCVVVYWDPPLGFSGYHWGACTSSAVLFFLQPTVCSVLGIITVLSRTWSIQMAALIWCQGSHWSAGRRLVRINASSFTACHGIDICATCCLYS